MDLSMVRPKQAKKQTKRLGRGSGSGWGGTSGRGNKGAGSRSGKTVPYIGHCGGNIPYTRKIPKRGFTSHSNLDYQLVNLSDLQSKAADKKEITPETLESLGLIKDASRPIKILANVSGEFKLRMFIKADVFSKKAQAIIEKAGGKVECLKR